MFLHYQDRRVLFDKENLQAHVIQRSISSSIIFATWLFFVDQNALTFEFTIS